MSIGEIIAILALLIAIFQTMLAWISHEGISLSLSSGDWLRLLMNLIASALIVGGLSQASGESLIVFFVGYLLINEFPFFININRENLNAGCVGFLVFMSLLMICLMLIVIISFVPVVSHACRIRSFGEIFKIMIESGECFSLSGLEGVMLMIFHFFNVFNILNGLSVSSTTNNWEILRLMNWLACGIGVCLGYGFRIIFL